jgi:hypothetical protein
VDVSVEAAQEYVSTRAPTTRPNPGQGVLPSHNGPGARHVSNTSSRPPTQSGTVSGSHQQHPLQNFGPGNNSAIQSRYQPSQNQLISQAMQSRYIHWCVDSNKWETQLYHIQVSDLSDGNFIDKLKESYDRTLGFWRWLSLTTCHSVKFVVVSQAF